MLAASLNNLQILRCLISSGAEVNHRDCSGWTALQISSYLGHHEVVHTLLAAGAELSQQGKQLVSCLAWAAVAAGLRQSCARPAVWPLGRVRARGALAPGPCRRRLRLPGLAARATRAQACRYIMRSGHGTARPPCQPKYPCPH